ncbi:5-hydroxytryptamine receptor 1B-like [Amphiura filiformis]|uniref:5-hydroxytryptamine receptor 1B-like n=1 Tax=Amphiura filiformis TaxID=82378 RepID=UPI003B211ED4
MYPSQQPPFAADAVLPPYKEAPIIGITDLPNISDGIEEEAFTRPFLPWQEAIIITVLTAIILFTTCGNCLVILSVCLDRKLRKTPNILIINLAVADLCVGLLVMPFGTAYQITGRWIFGRELCNLYITFDMLACTASIATLCGISLDRYLVITRPLRYAPKRKPKLMVLFVAIVWISAILISIVPLFIGGAVIEDGMCIVNQDYTFTIFSTFGAFYVPLLIMITLYLKIYQAARKSRKADLRQRRVSIGMLRRGSHDSNFNRSIKIPNSNGSLDGSNSNMLKRGSNESEDSGVEEMTPRTRAQRRLTIILAKTRASLSSLGSARRILMSKEPKAVRTLGVIVGCFTLCWLPFFIVALFRPYCNNCTISPTLINVFLWLGYINSTLNPVIYPLFNKDFGPAYRKMLSCKCSLYEPREFDDSYWRNERRRSSLGIGGGGSDRDSDMSHLGTPVKHALSRQSSVQFDDAPQIRKYSLKMDIINCNRKSSLTPIPSIVTVDEDSEESEDSLSNMLPSTSAPQAV